MDAPDLSVITVTFGRVELLARKAAALVAQTLEPQRFEWCVTTNGDPAAAALLRGLELPFALRLVESSTNGPVAAARNAAAAEASADVLLLSDDDVLPGPSCLMEHIAAHAGAGTAPGRVVIGDLRLPDELRGGSVREPFERPASLGARALWINATGANTSLLRTAFASVGGYDATFAAYGGEDSDLALRLKREGATFRRSRNAWATHVGRVLPDTSKAYLAGRAGARVWRTHGGAATAFMLGVHPIGLALKRALLGTPLRHLYDPDTAAYERAYTRGARDELRERQPAEADTHTAPSTGQEPPRPARSPTEERR